MDPTFFERAIFLCLGVSICLNVVSIETLNLDMVLKSVVTVTKFWTVSKIM
jgi:hypothetical protein